MGADRSYRAIVEGMGAGAAAVSERGIVLYANRQLADLLGRDRPALVGSPAIELFTEQDRGGVEEMLSGVLVRCLIMTDRTSYEKAERALAETNAALAEHGTLERVNRELAASNTDLEQFAYVASHDLQEPLRMVASYTTLLAEDLGDSLNDTARRHLDFAHDGAVRMHRLVHDFLEYSRASRADEDWQRVDCDRLVEMATRGSARGHRRGGGDGDPRPAANVKGNADRAPAAVYEPGRQRSQVPRRPTRPGTHRRRPRRPDVAVFGR